MRIVIASPSDVQAERDLLPGIIDELNRGIAAGIGGSLIAGTLGDNLIIGGSNSPQLAAVY